MKHIIMFDLKPDSDDTHKLEVHMQAHKMYSALTDLDETIRKHYKYGDGKPVSWQTVREMFRDIISGNDVDLHIGD